MKFNIISNTLILFLIVLVFSSLIYAPWTENNPPLRPTNYNILMTCAEWIHYNGFTLDNYGFNRENAISRDFANDRKASTWAAIYAFKISGMEDTYQLMPQDFCDSFVDENHVPMRFKALEDESKSCEDWIKLYGFTENHRDNYDYALNVDPSQVKYISIWAFSFWLFLWEHDGLYWSTPYHLCRKMGIDDGTDIPFWSDHGTLLTCIDWLILYNLYHDPEFNLDMARNLIIVLMYTPIRVHYFSERYALDLVRKTALGHPINELTPVAFCERFDGHGPEPQRYEFHYEGQ